MRVWLGFLSSRFAFFLYIPSRHVVTDFYQYFARPPCYFMSLFFSLCKYRFFAAVWMPPGLEYISRSPLRPCDTVIALKQSFVYNSNHPLTRSSCSRNTSVQTPENFKHCSMRAFSSSKTTLHSNRENKLTFCGGEGAAILHGMYDDEWG